MFSDSSLLHPTPTPWRRIRLLGKGCFGVVYLAVYLKPNSNIGFRRPIAVKTARLKDAYSLIKEDKIYKVFKDCPEIARCYSNQITTEAGLLHYNLLLEYAPGGTLENLIERTRGLGLPERDVRVYARMILRGLRCMHEKGYVHCDLKPSNILAIPCDQHGDGTAYKLKLADFGAVKEPHEDRPREEGIGKFRGTPDYMSPESVALGLIWPRLDIWSFGCVVVRMICGCESPWLGYENLNLPEFLYHLVCSSFMTPTIPPFMSEVGKDFLRKCLQRDPRKRWTAEMLLRHPYVDGLNANTTTQTTSVQCYYSNDSPLIVPGVGWALLP